MSILSWLGDKKKQFHVSSALNFDMYDFFAINTNLVKKNPNIFAFNFKHFPILLYQGFLSMKVNKA